jgi:tetratricopeptide (TPR) repeat protein
MYNLLISLALSLLGYAVGALVAGWLAGFLPAIIVLLTAYFFLARRTGRQLEALMKQAGDAFQAQKLDRGRELLQQGFALAKWQFLVAEQLHAQLGAVDYLQRNWKGAREHLEKSWSRNWMSQAMLACLDHREGKPAEALARMEKATGPGGGDPSFWAVYGWLALESGDRDKAVAVLAQGLKKNEASKPLAELADAVRNKKRIRPDKQFAGFAPGWYQFFPEHIPPQQVAQMTGQKAPGYSYPAPRGFRRG